MSEIVCTVDDTYMHCGSKGFSGTIETKCRVNKVRGRYGGEERRSKDCYKPDLDA